MNKEVAERLALVERSRGRLAKLREMLMNETNYYRELVDDLERIKPQKQIKFRYVPNWGDLSPNVVSEAPLETAWVQVFEGETENEALGRTFNANPEHFRIEP